MTVFWYSIPEAAPRASETARGVAHRSQPSIFYTFKPVKSWRARRSGYSSGYPIRLASKSAAYVLKHAMVKLSGSPISVLKPASFAVSRGHQHPRVPVRLLGDWFSTWNLWYSYNLGTDNGAVGVWYGNHMNIQLRNSQIARTKSLSSVTAKWQLYSHLSPSPPFISTAF